MSWLLSLWKSDDLALAIDPTTPEDRLCAIVVSAVYRGCAIPVAWVVKPGNKPGEWMESTAELLDPLVGCGSHEYADARDDGSRTEKPNLWKSVGWQWQKTQRTTPARVERHWLVLASATLRTLAYGSRVEDAQARKKSPGALRSPPKSAPERSRITGVFRLGMAILSRLPAKGRLWRRVRLLPEPWSPPPEGVKVVLHPEN